LAQAAADETAASVANAAYQRATLAELQAVSGAAEGAIGVVYGDNDDRGTYRYISAAWVYESATLPQVDERVVTIEGAIEPAPTEQTRALVVADPEGNTALELSGDGAEFSTAGATLRRNVDTSVDLERLDGLGLSIQLTESGVSIGDAEQIVAPPDITWAVSDIDGFAALATHDDGSVQFGGLRTAANEDGGVDILTPDGSLFYNAQSGIAGLTFEQVDRDDIEVAWADSEGFFAFAIKPDGSVLGTGFATGGGGDDTGAYSLAEINARNAANLAYSVQVARTGNTTAQRPTAAFNHFLNDGQSLSTGLTSWPSLTRTAPFQGNLMVGNSVNRSGASGWVGVGDNDLHPMVATVLNGSGVLVTPEEQALLSPGTSYRGETPLEAALTVLRQAWNDKFGVEDDLTRKFIGSCVGFGGQDVAALSKGGLYYDWVTDCATLGKAAATAASGTYAVPALLWIQGEQDYFNGTTKADYKTILKQLVADIRADVQVAIAGQSRPFMVVTYQTGGSYTEDGLDLAIGMAQVELMQEEPE